MKRRTKKARSNKKKAQKQNTALARPRKEAKAAAQNSCHTKNKKKRELPEAGTKNDQGQGNEMK